MDRFILQLGHPKINQSTFPAFKQVKEAFICLFRLEEESIYLFWQQIPIQFRYQADLYHNFDEILGMVWLVQRDEQGATKVSFTTQLLTINWELHWKSDNLVINSTFSAQDDLYVPYAQALNQWSEINLSKQAFLSEWKTLLHQIIVAFQASHIQIQDGTERRKWELLQCVERQIPQYGQLYLKPT